MIKTILVPVNGEDSDALPLATALGLARTFNAHLDVLHIRLDPIEVAVGMTVDAAGGTLITGLIDGLEHDAAEREARIRDNFERFCQRENLAVLTAHGEPDKPSAELHVETGQERRWLATYGLTADVIVSCRGNPESGGARAKLETLLIETGRPLLIAGDAVPPTPVPDSIAIGWKPMAQCARAVAAAMPLLLRAKQVVVLSVEENEPGRGDDSDRLVRSLAWHGIAVTSEWLQPGPENAIDALFAAAKERAGLLVMGGYGHSRMRQWVFGGFTQRALAGAPLPVLLAH
jgi:nucleotide-binding universal stress UspA family protein